MAEDKPLQEDKPAPLTLYRPDGTTFTTSPTIEAKVEEPIEEKKEKKETESVPDKPQITETKSSKRDYKIAIFSDMEGNSANLDRVTRFLQKEKVDIIVIAGESGNSGKEIYHNIKKFAETGITTAVITGSHESIQNYESSMAQLVSEFDNVINGVHVRKLEYEKFDIVFIPGSDSSAGYGQYGLTYLDKHDLIDNKGSSIITSPDQADIEEVKKKSFGDQLKNGKIDAKDVLKQAKNYEIGDVKPENIKILDSGEEVLKEVFENNFIVRLKNGKYEVRGNKLESKYLPGKGYLSAVDDLEKLVARPNRTLVFSHVPLRFENNRNAVDYACFGEMEHDEDGIAQQSIVPGMNPAITYLNQLWDLAGSNGKKTPIKKENRGHEGFAKVRDKIWGDEKTEKFFNGHFEESVSKCHDRDVNLIEPGKRVKNMYLNASVFNAHMNRFSILTTSGLTVKHQFYDLNNL